MTHVVACPACVAAPLALQTAAAGQDETPDIYLSLPSIHCAACIGKVERALRATPGVRSARVNLSLKRVAVCAPGLPAESLSEVLSGVGFEAHPLDPALITGREDAQARSLLLRLAVAGFAMMNVMLFSVAIWSGATDATREMFHLISAVIALPTVLFSGQPFFQSAWRALRVRALNMDVPISLAILLAAGMSLYEVLNGGRHAYFDAALSLTFFLLVGRYLDHRSRAAAHSAAADLSALEVHSAQRMEGARAVTVRVSALRVGDLVSIPTGVRVPVDGVLETAGAQTDRSFLTGESAAFAVARGDLVQAGEINLGAPFMLRATAVGPDTTLRRIAAMVDMAENSRNSYTNLADRAARIYAPAVHLLAFVAFAAWVWVDGDIRHALNVAVAVLIITCPCALGLAVPAVATAAISRLYGLGFLVKSGDALERLAQTDVVVFDKTGTLTVSGARLGGLRDDHAAVALALAQASNHPAARAIAAELSPHQPAEITAITEVPGCGMQGQLSGQTVRLGRADWLGAGSEGLALRIGTEPAVALQLTETLRPGAAEAVSGLRKAGFDLLILSGDAKAAVQAMASRIGIVDFKAAISGTDKHAHLRKMAAEGQRVLMVGDGLNDTAALAAAHASLAPSSALDASRSAADIVLLRNSLADLPLLVSIARAATQLSRQNFAIAAIYNLIAVPIALLGQATPLMAAIAMSASSITVLLNALRVRRAK